MRKCYFCKGFAEPNKSCCQKHLKKIATVSRDNRAERRKRGLCVQCGKKPVYNQALCKICNTCFTDRRQKRKIVVLTYYGKYGRMHCCWKSCNIVDPDMLSIDHINNDGAQETAGSGESLYRYLIKKKFPKGFQTLCMNHQFKKQIARLRKFKTRRLK